MTGETSNWLRVRLQEELHAHGLDGNVAQADHKTLVVVVEGDLRRIKRFCADIAEALPKDIKLGELVLSKTKSHLKPVQDPMTQVFELLQSLEQRIIRMESRVNAILARLEAGGYRAEAGGSFEYGGAGGTTEESASAFSRMFGD